MTFSLIVTDDDGDSSTADTVDITVNDVGVNNAPTADAGPDQSVTEGVTVNLDGTGSSDDSAIATYSWAIIDADGETLTLNNDDTVNSSFDSPTPGSTKTYVFELTVTDDGTPGLQNTDQVSITTNSAYDGTVSGTHSGDLNIPSGQSWLITGTGTVTGSVKMQGGTLVMESGSRVSSDVITESGSNSITINGADIDGAVKVNDETSSNPVIITNSDIDSGMEIFDSQNITITGNTFGSTVKITDSQNVLIDGLANSISGDLLLIGTNTGTCSITSGLVTGTQNSCW